MSKDLLSQLDKLKTSSPEVQKVFIDNIKENSMKYAIKLMDSNADEERTLQQIVDEMTEATIGNMMKNIKFIGRPEQQYPKGDWDTWLVLAGRGFGKTMCGSHTVNNWALENPGCRIAIVVEKAKDIERVLIQGDSGIINQSRPTFRPTFISGAKNYFIYPNGSIAFVYYGTTPEDLRGPQHHFAWVDELAKMRYQDDVWEQLNIGLRAGKHPRVLVTTTPRPTELIKQLNADPDTHLTIGTTYDNKHLPAATIRKYEKLWKGTRLEAQELYAQILTANPNALFSLDNFSDNRVQREAAMKKIVKIVVAVDPAVTSNEHSDSTGIIVAGIDAEEHGYVLEDKTFIGKPDEWAAEAIRLYHKYEANYIVAEVNQGGDMVETIIRNIDPLIAYQSVRATKGKILRAEPIAALYSQNRIHHIGSNFDELEAQMSAFDSTLPSKKSPDRLDALVWAFTCLFGISSAEPNIRFI